MDLLDALKATYMTVGQDVTDTQLAMVTSDLAPYPLTDVLQALARCRKELRKIALVDILDRLPNGHPGPEEAWALVSQCFTHEFATLVWSDEMRAAFGVAHPLREDLIAARMAFKEQYQTLMRQARAEHRTPHWSVSLGSDIAGRELAIAEGVKKGRLHVDYAQRLLPHPQEPETIKLLASLCPRLLA